MLNKWAFIFYVCSSLALLYAAVVRSPLRVGRDAFENTDTPILFFGLVVVFIIHIVWTGKMLSQEKFKKVMWVSTYIFVGSILLVFHKLIVALFFYGLSFI